MQKTLRYLEDYPVGGSEEFGEIVVDADEIRDFASKWDPQPFHLGDGGGPEGPYGGLIASGWHTGVMVMKMLVTQGAISGETSMGSPGLDIRWKAPVRPGDRLRAQLNITENRPSQTKPDRGTLRFDCIVRNQNDEVVMTIDWVAIIRRRPPTSP